MADTEDAAAAAQSPTGGAGGQQETNGHGYAASSHPASTSPQALLETHESARDSALPPSVPSTASAAPSPTAAAVSPSAAPRLQYLNLLEHPFTDDCTRLVAQLLYRHALRPHLELEAKLGRCRQPGSSGRRVRLEGLQDQLLLLDDSLPHVFHAELEQRVWAHLQDRVLKGRFEQEQLTARREQRRPTLHYAHPVTTDLFYEGRGVDGGLVRVTVDQQTAACTAIVKRKLEHLDCLLPSLGLPDGIDAVDFRITASQELPAPLPPASAAPHRIRRKDRRSYSSSIWRVDCTVVESWQQCRRAAAAAGGWEGEGKKQTGYEVEVEMLQSAVEQLRAEAVKQAEKKENEIVDIARNLLDNMRTLAKVALSPVPDSCIVRKQPAAAVPAAAPAAAGEERGKKRAREEAAAEEVNVSVRS